MSSIVFWDNTDMSLTEAQRRQAGMIRAGHDLANAINANATAASPDHSEQKAKQIVFDVIDAFIADPDLTITYLKNNIELSKGGSAGEYHYTLNGRRRTLTITPKFDRPKAKMTVSVPTPSLETGATDVLQGYGDDVIRDLVDIILGSQEQAKYFLATVMFRRCR